MITLRLFNALTGLAALIGMWRIYHSSPGDRLIPAALSGFFTLFGALVGARAGFVLAHPLYYSLHPDQAAQFWRGGFNAFGALAGAVLFALLAAAIFRQRALPTLDLTSLLLLPMGTLVWLGLWYEGTAYSRTLASTNRFGMPTPDETGMLSNRFPLQFTAAISLLLLLILIEHLTKNSRPGFRFALIGMGFSAHTLIISMFRADPAFLIQGFRSDAYFSLLFAAAFALVLLILLLPSAAKKDKMKSEV